MNRVPDWVAEFGEDWQVPDVIALAEGIEDMSWHNDVSPSFGLHVAEGDNHYAHTVRIWCDHPDCEEREYAGYARYMVTYSADAEPIAGVPCAGRDGTDWLTDDPLEALRVFLRSLQYVRVSVRDRMRS